MTLLQFLGSLFLIFLTKIFKKMGLKWTTKDWMDYGQFSQQSNKIRSWNLRGGEITKVNPSFLTWERGEPGGWRVLYHKIRVANDSVDSRASKAMLSPMCNTVTVNSCCLLLHTGNPFPKLSLTFSFSADRQCFSITTHSHWADQH